jgi:hypothetical protein
MSYIYLASPYSHKDETVQRKRWEAVMNACAYLAPRERQAIYSPIAHWGLIAKLHSLPTDHEYWQYQNYAMIVSCTAVWVLKLVGWTDSDGVASEVRFATTLGKPVLYLDPPAGIEKEYDLREQPE